MSENDDSCEKLRAAENAQGHLHGHIHEHIDNHLHAHIHAHACPANHPDYGELAGAEGEVATIRSHSGLSGDMMLAGFAILNLEKMRLDPQGPEAEAWLRELLDGIMPDLGGKVRVLAHEVNGIGGWQARVDLPQAHEHRNLADVRQIIGQAGMSDAAKENATGCFELIAACEAQVHGKKPEEVHFHEVGALDSILDICAVCELYDRLGSPVLICGPLPVADGEIACAHGILPAPAPATLRMLAGVPVRPFGGSSQAGELVTPTAIGLLRALKARFGPWPGFRLQYSAIVYGQRVFPRAPNGAIFALGSVASD